MSNEWYYKKKAAILLLLALTWCLYAQSLGFAYVWDDGVIFLDKNDLMTQPLSWGLISQPVLEGTTYFRPVIFLTWFIEFHIFGQNPVISHAINLLLFSLNVILVYWLACQILEKAGFKNVQIRALFSAGFYAVHPALIQAVAWVSGRFDVMCTTFCLLACCIFVSQKITGWLKSLVIGFCFILALLSKELGVVLPFLLICVGLASSSGTEKGLSSIIKIFSQERKTFFALIVFGVLYGILRTVTVSRIYHSTINFQHFEAIVKTLLPMQTLQEYAILAFLPFGRISLFYPYGDLDWWSSYSLVIYPLMAFFIAFSIWKAVWKGKVWAWMLLASLISFSLVLHIIPLWIAGSLVQDRFMTLPLAFLGIFVASLELRKIRFLRNYISARAMKLMVTVGMVGWLLLASLVTITTIPVWKTPLNLWAWAHQSTPDAGVVSYNYMQAALTEERFDLVEKEIERLKEINGGLGVPEQILYANLLTRKGDAEAVKYMEGIMYAMPDFQSIKNGRQMLIDLGLTSEQVGGSLMDYANAKLAFDGDLKAAAKYNKIAEWYFGSGQRVPVALQRATIEYLTGDYSKAKATVDAQKDIYYFGKNRYIKNMSGAVLLFCNRWQDSKEDVRKTCEELRSQVLPEAFESYK
ncbi:ArnT family glycosyltransferase [Comamonas sp. 4034]|uniref:ArnT family glycosyltransferase n=1 Tax=Comamonas sp. 4034 TaxID=3156455 RepID=UPI003D1A8AA5